MAAARHASLHASAICGEPQSIAKSIPPTGFATSLAIFGEQAGMVLLRQRMIKGYHDADMIDQLTDPAALS